MKTQMQIVEEAITKLESMDRDGFRDSFTKDDAVEIREILNINAETISLTGTFEEKAAKLMEMFNCTSLSDNSE